MKSIFIVGWGRTGSTLLNKILNTIPGATIRGENYNTLYHLYKAVSSAEYTSNYAGKLSNTTKGPWYGAPLVKPDRFADKLITPFITEILNIEPLTRIMGFKEIRYIDCEDKEDFLNYLTFISEYFPDAHFIFNTRDTKETVNSGWWSRWDQDEKVELADKLDRVRGWFDHGSRIFKRSISIEYPSWTNLESGELEKVFDLIGESKYYDKEAIQEILDIPLIHCQKKVKLK